MTDNKTSGDNQKKADFEIKAKDESDKNKRKYVLNETTKT